MVSTFNTLIPNNKWSLLYATTVMEIISNVPSKVAIILIRFRQLEIALSQFPFAYFLPEVSQN